MSDTWKSKLLWENDTARVTSFNDTYNQQIFGDLAIRRTLVPSPCLGKAMGAQLGRYIGSHARGTGPAISPPFVRPGLPKLIG